MVTERARGEQSTDQPEELTREARSFMILFLFPFSSSFPYEEFQDMSEKRKGNILISS